jgi:UrcA family protein
MYRRIPAIMIFALAFGIQSAHAAAAQDLPSVAVRSADLDLSSADGTAVLYQRIRNASERVCAGFDGAGLTRRTAFRECVQTLISNTVAKVNQPTLTAYAKSTARKPSI